MKAKKFYKSRTFWVEMLQALGGLGSGIILALQGGLDEVAIAALMVGAKGVYGVYLRFSTNQAIEL